MTAGTQTLMERFDALADRHISTVRLMCWRRSYGNEATCDDLMQECLVSIWRRLPTLRADCTAREEKAWVRWCCRSVFSHLHRQHRLSVTGLTPDMTDTLASPADKGGEAREIVETLAVGLTHRERNALALMIEGYSQKEIAAILGIRVDSMAKLKRRIVQKMQQRYEKVKKALI